MKNLIYTKEYLSSHINDIFQNGMPQGYKVGLSSFDNICRLDGGRLITITGVPNSGKSEFVDYLCVQYNKLYGMKTLYYSPENQPVGLHIAKLVSKFENQKFDRNQLTTERFCGASHYVLDNFFFTDYEKVSTLNQILESAEQLIQEESIKILVIDSYNKIESDKSATETETDFISKVLDRLCQFAISNNIMVFLVAHPRKMEWNSSDKCYRCPEAYDINGSANFYNKSDFVIAVHRQNQEVLIKVEKVKFKQYGSIGQCTLSYDNASGNYLCKEDEILTDEDYNSYSTDDSKKSSEFDYGKGDLLDAEVSYYCGATDNTGRRIKLRDFLFTDKYRDIAQQIRKGKTPEERHNIKNQLKNKIPAITISGLFSKRNNESLVAPSNYMCLDIDMKDNQEIMSEVPNILKGLPYILYISKSITGDGYFAICRISDASNFLAHFRALEKEMKQYRIVVDKACKDMTRLRFATYDSDFYYNQYAYTYERIDNENMEEQIPSQDGFFSSLNRDNDKSFVYTSSNQKRAQEEIDEICTNHMEIPDDYNTWFKMALSLLATFGEVDGRKNFHLLSKLSPKYNEQECEEQFNKVVNNYKNSNQCTEGTLFQILDRAKMPDTIKRGGDNEKGK